MDEVFINQEVDPYVIEADGTLDVAALQLQPATVVINGLVVRPTPKLQTETGPLVLRDATAGSMAHPLRISGALLAGRAMNLQAACPHEQASKYAAYLQSQAGKQQLESASGLSLPTGTSLMGLPQYGRQLYMRPSYLQLRDILVQLFKDADPPMMILQALQDTSNQILATGYHESSDKIFHMTCHGVLVYGYPQVVYATKFAAQLVFYKLGEAARRQQLAWFHSASDHTHWQVARGYWFESMAHQVLSNGGDFPFRLLGFTALKAARLPSCNLNNYVEPPLSDGVKLLHMIVTTPDRFDTCYQKQNVNKQGAAAFQTGVMKVDLSAAFGRLRQELGEAAAGLNHLEAMAIDTDVQE
ncbi:TPA: hypothetical protein ACH3X1_010162 [Trebouxia sp. C0004]